MSVNEMIKKFPAALNADAAADLNATIQYKISNPMYLEIKNGQCTVHDGMAPSADVTLTMEDDDLAALLKGELNGMTAFMTGKLQVDGDLMLAQRLPTLFDPSKL
ncbi:MAG TPA: SCP2 sterol-binding domain-containing protein [Nevskiales bacterium]|nr:SCP2 sterol-binding domain-containing protein [Nevskiales bacterium]